MTTSLSNRLYALLRVFGSNSWFSLSAVAHYDQRAFRSMLVRQYIDYRPDKGFRMTPLGRDVLQSFKETDISRTDPSLPLTSYFDPAAYGLTPKEPAKPTHRQTKAA
jgi:hypothetical protein